MKSKKNSAQTRQNISKMPLSNKKVQQRPEIRDDLDSRKNEEQLFKQDNTTHNTKKTNNKK